MRTALQSFRGFHYDLARGNYDSLQSLRRLVEFMAACGLNELVLYMEDLWRYRRHPQLANAHAYAFEDLQRLAEYAAKRGVDLIPSLTTMGHSAHILHKPRYRHLASPGPAADFDVLNPEVYQLFGELFDEVLPHFASPYVFINGDEMQLMGLSAAAKREARRHGLGSLHGRAMGRLARMILERNRRPIVWHDMLLHHPEGLAYLPRQTIIAFWFYDPQTDFPAIRYFCQQGYDVIAASGLLDQAGAIPDYARALPNIVGMARAAAANAAPRKNGSGVCLGTMLTVWEGLAWRDALLAIYANGRLTREARVSAETILRDFGRDVFGAPAPRFGASWREAARLTGQLVLCKSALMLDQSAAEKRLLQATRQQLQRKLAAQTEQMRAAPLRRNRDLYQPIRRLAGKMATIRLAPAKPSPVPELLAPALVGRPDRACRLIKTRTTYGHEIQVLTNGLIAVAILPEFGATMIEWVWLGKQPWSAIAAYYGRWAAAAKRLPGDPGLGSPWGTSGLSGWRETVFYNARLNPSSLWGRPFQVRPIRCTPDEVAVECVGHNEVAQIRRVVRLVRGQPTIALDITATNRRGPCALALQPNVGHQLPGTTVPLLQVVEANGARLRRRPLLNHDGSKQFVPTGNWVRVASATGGPFLEVRFRRSEMARFLTDAGPTVFTLEPFGVIRNCDKGDQVRLHLEYRLGE